MRQPKFTEQQRRLAHKIGYFIDCAEETKWLMNGAGWIGPDGASDCEMRLWAALEERVQQTDWDAGSKEKTSSGQSAAPGGRPGNGERASAAPSGINRMAKRAAAGAGAATDTESLRAFSLTARTVDGLAISRRTVACLTKYGILTLDTLVQKSGRELRRLPGIGVGSVLEIQTALSGHGLSLST